ncbi:hypothetical protein CGZ93_15810 [Enemella dayhoffiae]|uniref:Cation diffusion facilitator family transporter n=1 Tax=Enemella dayhoffiae TaxID=2016507 RepID=A0A255GSL8_9ACTN|nr:hypothetical protein [Enemella dayhoffiae]OYO18442.1 hypothetical protein CGZ93_15810 [Enemella dayhoffiae]
METATYTVRRTVPAKKKLAETLHDKVLYADATMNEDDWLTASGAIIGVLGIGLGIWWLDSVVAIGIGVSVVRDGFRNVRRALADLLDGRAHTFDNSAPHPSIIAAVQALEKLPWVESAGVRMRDQGHVFHTEAFVRPAGGATVSLAQLDEARTEVRRIDWKLQDTVIIPVTDVPPEASR